MITTEGTVISKRDVGDNDCFITILSPEKGIMEISVKGAKKLSSKNTASVQLFSAAKYCVSEKYGRYYLNSSEVIKIFYDLRKSIEALSLASYFADIVRFSATQGQSARDIYRLYMNSLHFLSKENADIELLKFIFEMRIASEIGMLPGLLGCADCYKFDDVKLYFDIRQGLIFCEEHLQKRALSPCADILAISRGQLEAMRHTCLADMSKLFNFRVNASSLKKLCYISEKFLTMHFHHNFNTLDFYNNTMNINRGNYIYEN